MQKRNGVIAMVLAAAMLAGCGGLAGNLKVDELIPVSEASEAVSDVQEASTDSASSVAEQDGTDDGRQEAGTEPVEIEVELDEPDGVDGDAGQTAEEPAETVITWDESWEYAGESKIHTDAVTLYRSQAEARHHIVVAVNAGHGCAGGESEQTYCHPDHSPKVTGGSTGAGAVTATAINSGMTFADGTREADAVLDLAGYLKEELLSRGYDVLMIREKGEDGDGDAQLDNIARTVFANNCADCHVSLHYDSTDSDKGMFYIRVPDVASYKAMEPVASHWQDHDALGEAIVQGAREAGIGIYSGGSLALDLTQTSYSTVPSVDVEVGDKRSDHSEAAQRPVAAGIAAGIDAYFAERNVQ